jgi:hypothetical protein
MTMCEIKDVNPLYCSSFIISSYTSNSKNGKRTVRTINTTVIIENGSLSDNSARKYVDNKRIILNRWMRGALPNENIPSYVMNLGWLIVDV